MPWPTVKKKKNKTIAISFFLFYPHFIQVFTTLLVRVFIIMLFRLRNKFHLLNFHLINKQVSLIIFKSKLNQFISHQNIFQVLLNLFASIN